MASWALGAKEAEHTTVETAELPERTADTRHISIFTCFTKALQGRTSRVPALPSIILLFHATSYLCPLHACWDSAVAISDATRGSKGCKPDCETHIYGSLAEPANINVNTITIPEARFNTRENSGAAEPISTIEDHSSSAAIVIWWDDTKHTCASGGNCKQEPEQRHIPICLLSGIDEGEHACDYC